MHRCSKTSTHTCFHTNCSENMFLISCAIYTNVLHSLMCSSRKILLSQQASTLSITSIPHHQLLRQPRTPHYQPPQHSLQLLSITHLQQHAALPALNAASLIFALPSAVLIFSTLSTACTSCVYFYPARSPTVSLQCMYQHSITTPPITPPTRCSLLTCILFLLRARFCCRHLHRPAIIVFYSYVKAFITATHSQFLSRRR